ncbi:G-protein coupled receptor 83-like [Oppia nitens]|uniref:G-protein coupled receptor 83-like n=1 Tax=Oppia nitens TaxID=1686743 RepID=UPI0023DCDD62|nr:G-protein coupled receptor 83-like [Oppia nitens]
MDEFMHKGTVSNIGAFIVVPSVAIDNTMVYSNGCYSLIILVSLIGNLIVLRVIFGKQRSLTTTNILIANLAVADLLMTVMNIPFNIARILLDNWPFGQILCVLVPLIQSISVYCSSITMMFIAIERYKSLIYSTHITRGYCLGKCFPFGKILSIIWLSSILLSVHNGVFNRIFIVKITKNSSLVRCRIEYPEPRIVWRQTLTSLTFLTQYLIPITITCICYLKICWFIYRRKIVGQITESHRSTLVRRKWRRIKMLIMVVLVFAICWLPFNVFHLLMDFYIIGYSYTLFFVNHWFAMSSVCYNPFIYCWLNNDFRNEFKSLFKCLTSGVQRMHSQSSDGNTIRMNTIVERLDSNYEISEDQDI